MSDYLQVSSCSCTETETKCMSCSSSSSSSSNDILFSIAHIFIWIQNISVLAATFFCYLLLNNDNGDRSEDMLHYGTNGRLKGVPTSLYGIG